MYAGVCGTPTAGEPVVLTVQLAQIASLLLLTQGRRVHCQLKSNRILQLQATIPKAVVCTVEFSWCTHTFTWMVPLQSKVNPPTFLSS